MTPPRLLKNQFSVVYSDITLLNLQGEITVRPSDSWKIFLKANYYSYTLSTMNLADGTSRNLRDDDHAWNKPDIRCLPAGPVQHERQDPGHHGDIHHREALL